MLSEIVDLIVMLLLLHSLLQPLECARLFNELLQIDDLLASFTLTLLQALHLLEDHLVVVVIIAILEWV